MTITSKRGTYIEIGTRLYIGYQVLETTEDMWTIECGCCRRIIPFLALTKTDLVVFPQTPFEEVMHGSLPRSVKCATCFVVSNIY